MNTTVNTSTRRMSIAGYNAILSSMNERKADEQASRMALKQKSQEEMMADSQNKINVLELNDKEVALIQRLTDYPNAVKQAGDEFSPAVLCNYAFALAQEFNSFYHDYSILNEADEQKKNLRLLLSAEVAKVLKHSMSLLGIEMPNRM